MSWIRASILLFLLAAPQETTVELRIQTKEGHVLVGSTPMTSLKLESSLGALDLKLKDLESIKFDGDQATVTTRDRSNFKGKHPLEGVKVKWTLAETSVKVGAIQLIRVHHNFTPPAPIPAPTGKETFSGQIGLKDGTRINGTFDSPTCGFESSLGTFDVSFVYVERLTRSNDVFDLVLKDGSSLRGKPTLGDFKFKTTVGEFKVMASELDMLNLHKVQGAAPAPEEPEPGPKKRGPAPSPPGAPASDPPPAKSPALKPAQAVDLKVVLGALRISKDGTRLYAVNQSDGKLLRWKLPGLESDGEVGLSGSEKSLALDPAGKKIYAGGQKVVTIIDAEPLALKKSFAVELNLDSLFVIDGDHLFGAGFEGSGLISVSKTSVLQKFRSQQARLSASPDGQRIYGTDTDFAVRLRAGGLVQVEMIQTTGMAPRGEVGPLSPDGRYSCSPALDQIFRMGKCWAASRVVLGPIEPHEVAAFSADNRSLHLLTAEGFLKTYDVPSFTLKVSHYLGVRPTQALALADGSLIVAADRTDPGRRPPRARDNTGRVVDLVRFEIPK